MPGFERNRFIDLVDSIADGLTCIICLNIFDNPVITDCGHTYCYGCLRSNICIGSHECPKCRKQMTINKSNENLNFDNRIVIEDAFGTFVFVRNLTVNSMVSQLRIKCESNECPAVMELDLLPAHLKQCEHRICETCDFKVGKTEDHNCLQLLKNNFNDYKQKYEKCERTLTETIDKLEKLDKQNQMNIKVWRMKCQKYEKTIQELQNMMSVLETNGDESVRLWSRSVSSLTEGVNFVMFGTLETKCLHCHINSIGIELKGVSHDFGEDFAPKDILIPFGKMQELKYCSELSVAVVIIQPTELLSFDIQKLLQSDQTLLNKFGLCIYSYEPGKRYIIIMLETKSTNLGSSLFEWSTASNPHLKPVIINWNQTQQLLDSALRVKNSSSDDSDIKSVIDSDLD